MQSRIRHELLVERPRGSVALPIRGWRGQAGLNRIEQLQGRIADVLGVSLRELSGFDPETDIVRVKDDPTRRADIAFSRECRDLLEAYTRITDPEQRQRCLDTVRLAAPP